MNSNYNVRSTSLIVTKLNLTEKDYVQVTERVRTSFFTANFILKNY